jgi:hypothetical protein
MLLPGAAGIFGEEAGIAGAMRAVVSAMAGGSDGAEGRGLAAGDGVETVGALLGVPPGFKATGGPGGGGGVAIGFANWGGGILEVSGGADFGGTGDLMIALPGLSVGAGAIMVEPAEGGLTALSGAGGFKLVSDPMALLFSSNELVVIVLPDSTSMDPGFGLRS